MVTLRKERHFYVLLIFHWIFYSKRNRKYYLVSMETQVDMLGRGLGEKTHWKHEPEGYVYCFIEVSKNSIYFKYMCFRDSESGLIVAYIEDEKTYLPE